MQPVTKEAYREYLCNRLKDLTECLEQPVPHHPMHRKGEIVEDSVLIFSMLLSLPASGI